MKARTISDEDLRSAITIQKKTRTGEYICDCPFCHKSLHLYINIKTQVFQCKKCWTEGSVYKLLKQLDKTYLMGDKSIEYKDNIKSIKEILEQQREKVELRELPEKKMPVGFKICKNNRYLKSRGISNDDCEYYKIGKTDLVTKYDNYILFPIYDGGKIRGYLGRYGAKEVPTDKLRYNNSKNTEFAELLYGYDEIVKGKTFTVIIVEGVFDKYSVDKKLGLRNDNSVKCVTTFGKKISDEQIQKLLDKDITNVILSWDYDALKEIKKSGIELNRFFNVSVGIATKEKDLGDCSAEEVVEVYTNLVPITEFIFNTISKLK